jgi:hypothetical protein
VALPRASLDARNDSDWAFAIRNGLLGRHADVKPHVWLVQQRYGWHFFVLRALSVL